MISIIIPVYNVEKYLERCVVSVCNQTYDDLEIILVDNSKKTVENYPFITKILQKKSKIQSFYLIF